MRIWCQWNPSHLLDSLSKFNWTDASSLMRVLSKAGFPCSLSACPLPLCRSLLSSPPHTHTHIHPTCPPPSLQPQSLSRRGAARRAGNQKQAAAAGGAGSGSRSQDTFPGSNMFPAWRRRGVRSCTGSGGDSKRTMFGAGQVGQVWVSCWILLLSTSIPSAHPQGNSVLFVCSWV